MSSLLGPVGVRAENGGKIVYKDPATPVDKRVDDLLARMTLDEKVAQMCCLWEGKNNLLDTAGNFDPKKAVAVIPSGIGHIGRPSDNRGRGAPDGIRTIGETVKLVNAVLS
jgi:beta-glucosidase